MVNIKELVRNYRYVTIFRHTSADADALGAQFGLKAYIQKAMPDKQVFALGHDVGSMYKFFPDVDDVEDNIIAESIAFVVDCANRERIDDQRFINADMIVKIDHHPDIEHYEYLQLVNTSAAATCEILTEMFSDDKENITPQCAKYLYMGIVADSLDFSTINTTAETLRAAATLIECHALPNEIREMQQCIDYQDFTLINFIRNNAVTDGKVIYTIISKLRYEALGFDYNRTKEKIYALANINQYPIWAIFTEFENGTFNGSLRSRSVRINDIATKYHGGGHPNACGVKNLTLRDIADIVAEMNEKLESDK